jgi:exopolyphosphatase/pppGpp-phosphohydrolase
MPRNSARSSALRRFGERLRGFEPETVRAVTTDAMRVARNARMVLVQAEAALGFPIEIIGGREEARLIFIGAANALPRPVTGGWWSISAAGLPSSSSASVPNRC